MQKKGLKIEKVIVKLVKPSLSEPRINTDVTDDFSLLISDQKFFGISETGFFEKTQEFDTLKYMLRMFRYLIADNK